eukprot:GHVN01001554.1.p1 GENE.GHVN01001554.1~~GHVN01001554.1.p1  ORF type:complete len:1228 (-),score=132.80 GHVN01001554.1:7384-11067(-)
MDTGEDGGSDFPPLGGVPDCHRKNSRRGRGKTQITAEKQHGKRDSITSVSTCDGSASVRDSRKSSSVNVESISDQTLGNGHEKKNMESETEEKVSKKPEPNTRLRALPIVWETGEPRPESEMSGPQTARDSVERTQQSSNRPPTNERSCGGNRQHETRPIFDFPPQMGMGPHVQERNFHPNNRNDRRSFFRYERDQRSLENQPAPRNVRQNKADQSTIQPSQRGNGQDARRPRQNRQATKWIGSNRNQNRQRHQGYQGHTGRHQYREGMQPSEQQPPPPPPPQTPLFGSPNQHILLGNRQNGVVNSQRIRGPTPPRAGAGSSRRRQNHGAGREARQTAQETEASSGRRAICGPSSVRTTVVPSLIESSSAVDQKRPPPSPPPVEPKVAVIAKTGSMLSENAMNDKCANHIKRPLQVPPAVPVNDSPAYYKSDIYHHGGPQYDPQLVPPMLTPHGEQLFGTGSGLGHEYIHAPEWSKRHWQHPTDPSQGQHHWHQPDNWSVYASVWHGYAPETPNTSHANSIIHRSYVKGYLEGECFGPAKLPGPPVIRSVSLYGAYPSAPPMTHPLFRPVRPFQHTLPKSAPISVPAFSRTDAVSHIKHSKSTSDVEEQDGEKEADEIVEFVLVEESGLSFSSQDGSPEDREGSALQAKDSQPVVTPKEPINTPSESLSASRGYYCFAQPNPPSCSFSSTVTKVPGSHPSPPLLPMPPATPPPPPPPPPPRIRLLGSAAHTGGGELVAQRLPGRSPPPSLPARCMARHELVTPSGDGPIATGKARPLSPVTFPARHSSDCQSSTLQWISEHPKSLDLMSQNRLLDGALRCMGETKKVESTNLENGGINETKHEGLTQNSVEWGTFANPPCFPQQRFMSSQYPGYVNLQDPNSLAESQWGNAPFSGNYTHAGWEYGAANPLAAEYKQTMHPSTRGPQSQGFAHARHMNNLQCQPGFPPSAQPVSGYLHARFERGNECGRNQRTTQQHRNGARRGRGGNRGGFRADRRWNGGHFHGFGQHFCQEIYDNSWARVPVAQPFYDAYQIPFFHEDGMQYECYVPSPQLAHVMPHAITTHPHSYSGQEDPSPHFPPHSDRLPSVCGDSGPPMPNTIATSSSTCIIVPTTSTSNEVETSHGLPIDASGAIGVREWSYDENGSVMPALSDASTAAPPSSSAGRSGDGGAQHSQGFATFPDVPYPGRSPGAFGPRWPELVEKMSKITDQELASHMDNGYECEQTFGW